MMAWTVYWFMLPVCVGVASVAMFAGISGAALLMPVFVFGFPLVGAPPLSTVAAIGMSLFLETSGFGTGVYRYASSGLVDWPTVKRLVIFTIPAAVAGSLLAPMAPGGLLKMIYGTVMVGLALIIWRDPSPAADEVGFGPPTRTLRRRDGTEYRIPEVGLGTQRLLSGVGAFLAGLISTGVGEATMPGLVRLGGYPVPVAAATSTVVVASTVVAAAATHLVELIAKGGLDAVPWNLLAWAVPGAVVGAFIGTHLQGRVPERAARRFFSLLFVLIGIAFLAAAAGQSSISLESG